MLITHEQLRNVLDYDPETGVFVWRVTLSSKGPRGHQAGTVTSKGYVIVTVCGRRHLAHRLAWFYVHGEWPPDQVDHINCDKADNRIANLRHATNAENHANRGVNKNNKSGFKGVTWFSPIRKWRAEIKVAGKNKHLGYFTGIEEAASAYERAAIEHFGEFARSA